MVAPFVMLPVTRSSSFTVGGEDRGSRQESEGRTMADVADSWVHIRENSFVQYRTNCSENVLAHSGLSLLVSIK